MVPERTSAKAELPRDAAQQAKTKATVMRDKGAQNRKRAGRCAHCGDAAQFKCVRCKVATYCSPKCQKAHWKSGGMQQVGPGTCGSANGHWTPARLCPKRKLFARRTMSRRVDKALTPKSHPTANPKEGTGSSVVLMGNFILYS